MMALAEDDSLAHGPLEVLMTVNEEIGGPNEGASGLDPSLLSGTILLNLDSEEDGKLTGGSASSTDTSIVVEKPRQPCAAGAVTLSVSVSGGVGGHSGVDIARGHADAIKLLGRVLREASTVAPLGIVSLQGGRSSNAIPRDAVAICSVPPAHEARFRDAVAAAGAAAIDAYRRTDPAVAVTVERTAEAADAWTDGGTRTLLDLVDVVPSGPLAMSPDFPGLVETSTSLDVAVSEGNRYELHRLPPRRRATRARPERSRVAAKPRLHRPCCNPARLRKTVRRGPDHHRGARLARDRRHRRQNPRPRHALVRPADRSTTLTRRTRQHPHRPTLLAPAGRRRRRALTT